MDPLDLIRIYYPPGSDIFVMLTAHCRAVADLSLTLARSLQDAGAASDMAPAMDLDLTFIEEAAMLHDIGIFRTNAPSLCCEGALPYLCHGIEGARLVAAHGLPRHALVCERHIGAGISAEQIRRNRLPLPERDMIPRTAEEEIIAFADKFYSKDCREIVKVKTPSAIISEFSRYGEEATGRFTAWLKKFGPYLPMNLRDSSASAP